ncbi:CopG family transcriptional regulator [Pseudomonas serbica]|uniref:CopG family transcriptional regulator n=1 Tax=Pseudomonas serbica TaxID=2965074 RepID=UPI0039E6BF6D
MTGISLSEDLSNSLADQAKTNDHTTSDLTAQIELAVKEADQDNFATEEKVSALRARRWSRNAS